MMSSPLARDSRSRPLQSTITSRTSVLSAKSYQSPPLRREATSWLIPTSPVRAATSSFRRPAIKLRVCASFEADSNSGMEDRCCYWGERAGVVLVGTGLRTSRRSMFAAWSVHRRKDAQLQPAGKGVEGLRVIPGQ